MTVPIRSTLTLALLLAGGPALAQGTQAQRAACTPDVWRLCARQRAAPRHAFRCHHTGTKKGVTCHRPVTLAIKTRRRGEHGIPVQQKTGGTTGGNDPRPMGVG